MYPDDAGFARLQRAIADCLLLQAGGNDFCVSNCQV
jgi:hypothetical protein